MVINSMFNNFFKKKKDKPNHALDIKEVSSSFQRVFEEVDSPVYRRKFINDLISHDASKEPKVVDEKFAGCLNQYSYSQLNMALYFFIHLGALDVHKKNNSHMVAKNNHTIDILKTVDIQDFMAFDEPQDDREFLDASINQKNELNTKNESKSESIGYFDKVFNGHDFVGRNLAERLYDYYKEHPNDFSDSGKEQLKSYGVLDDYRNKYNEKLVEKKLENEKDYLDGIIDKVDPNIILDKKQREVVLRDEDYTLVVAGAGAGKTTTIAAKVKYLVDKQEVDPKKILIVSYTNDAVNELKERINNQLGITTSITTFHKTGFAIVRKHNDAEKMNIAHDGLIYNLIRDYLTDHLKNRPQELKSLILFFGYYIDAPPSKETMESFINHFQRNDFTTLSTNVESITQSLIEVKSAKKETIQQEVMRSLEEVQIANFLYLNHVDYEYEASYPYHLSNAKKLYTPDFTIRQGDKVIYLEHFGITESGEHSRYTDDDLEAYKKRIHDKITLHRSKGTKLIYTFSQYNDGKSFLHHLKTMLEDEGIELQERSKKEIYEKITKDDSNKYFNKFIFLIKDFISSFKTNGYTETDFNRLASKTDNVRTKMFIRLCKPIYLHYQQFLEENDMLDFEDMINESSRLLDDPKTKALIPDFEYVIVDEYQDISMQRFDLTKSLSKLTKAKIVAVGDDWQSIFAFAGSRVDLFLKFKDIMGYADYLTIDHTYRNAQEVIDIAGSFIQKNSTQLRKNLISPKTIKKPIVLYEFSDVVYKNEKKGYKGIIHEKAKLITYIIKELVKDYGSNLKIALLGRYNFEHKQLVNSELFFEGRKGGIHSVKYPKVKLQFLTIHRSKGLGFDNVIILNGEDSVFGFPSQIEMDPLLKLVKYDDQSYTFAEERRLFYVGLTRTKNRVYILYPKTKPSAFVKEIAKEYDLVDYPSEFGEDIQLQDRKDKRCPICGYPLQFKKNKAYGLKLFMCSNEPEICDYMTNNLRSGKKSIFKCDQCKTGSMIVKYSPKNKQYFFGCTNYKSNAKGCTNAKPLGAD